MKKKGIAGLFALLMGMFGLHQFYLGRRMLGMAYFAATAFLFVLSIQNDAPIVGIMGLVVLIDAMMLFAMPQEDFDEKYNRRYFEKKTPRSEPFSPGYSRQAAAQAPVLSWKAGGIEKFKDYDFEGAIEDFKKSLAEQYEDPATHFNLACCYSLLERGDPAFFHLGKAVRHGFVDFDKIEKHDGLAFLRTQAEFREFVKNGYQRAAAPPPETENLLAQKPSAKAEKPAPDKSGQDLLEQIKQLSELRQRGILTEEEFAVQTRKIVGA